MIEVIHKNVTDELIEGVDAIILSKKLSNDKKRKELNKIEKEHPQNLFIKTHLCACGKMKVEMWFKIQEAEL